MFFQDQINFPKLPIQILVNALDQGQVSEVTISHDGTGNHNINGIKDGVPFQAEIILTDELMSLLQDKGKVDVKKPKCTNFFHFDQQFTRFCINFWTNILRIYKTNEKCRKRSNEFWKSRARLLNKDKNKITFDQVAGVDEAKEELSEVVEFLKDPKQFQKLGEKCQRVFCYAVRWNR